MNSEHDCENRFVNRLTQVRGPTPEFVRWSVDRACPLRKPIESDSPEKVERYLKPLTAVGQCLKLGRVIDDVCIAFSGSENEPARGCFLQEITDFYGGLEFCQSECGTCSANISDGDDPFAASASKSLAGCYGWLVRDDEVVRALTTLIAVRRDEFMSLKVFRDTRPAWYGLWTGTKLEGGTLDFVGRLFDQLMNDGDVPADWRRFQTATVVCRTKALPLSVQFVPAGRASGAEWIVGPYCPDCRGPMEVGIRLCEICRRHGHAHPAVRRKVLGQRPFLQLDSLVGPERARQLLRRMKEKDTSNSEST